MITKEVKSGEYLLILTFTDDKIPAKVEFVTPKETIEIIQIDDIKKLDIYYHQFFIGTAVDVGLYYELSYNHNKKVDYEYNLFIGLFNDVLLDELINHYICLNSIDESITVLNKIKNIYKELMSAMADYISKDGDMYDDNVFIYLKDNIEVIKDMQVSNELEGEKQDLIKKINLRFEYLKAMRETLTEKDEVDYIGGIFEV